ncbi:predicted protein [Sclerotinia sclerotiorum 1980 UF-70]|uniref:Uncharacterized protein n=1 Tax=Sclerotinia sclerotiorum (strain ATCC 18683 / 1980 / Ss-1) TaxID=665079 RepID=A7F9K0_SCLS1|nr:predicted protein [Sclerotinia sclerotiorum 1980 UF-70]EDO00411.1 predicted protein [Sclerotinia sclerotiorum 1980 UF-70]
MESRRRLGRRRMTHVTEMIQGPMYDLGALWCSSWGSEKIESQWKAPTPRINDRPKQSPILPSWLSNPTPMPDQPTEISTEITSVQESTENLYDMPQQERQIKDHFYDFEVSIEALRRKYTEKKRGRKAQKNKGRRQGLAGSTKALKLCLSFGEKLQESLTLGLVTSDLLSESLQAVTNVFMEIGSGYFSETKSSAKESLNMEDCFRGLHPAVIEQMLAFHKLVWAGIVSCKVFEPADFDSGVVGEYLLLLATLPSIKKTQLLISEVLPSLSTVQVESNVGNILFLLNKWSLSWLKKPKNPPDATKFLAKAEASLIASQRSINHIHAMSTTLAALSKDVASTLVRSHSEVICSAAFWNQRSLTGPKDYLAQSHRIRFNWLSVLSKLENIDDSMFAETFISLQQEDHSQFNLDTKKYTLTWRQISELVLNRWTSQGILTNGNVIINTFQMKSIHSPFSFGWLLWTLEKYGQLSDGMIRSLLDFLLDVKGFGYIHAVLKQSKMFNIRVNTNVLAGLVNSTASVDLQAAYNIYMQHCVGRVEPEACAYLFAAMVYHGSEGIWAALDVPIYAAMPKWKRESPSHKILSQARVELVHELAKAFAHHKVKNPRQALRNVTQCWHYLRAHNVEPTSEISRAVTQVGIIADIRDGNWGRTERVRWVLEVIEKAEGREVADAVRRAVATWREKLRIRLKQKK